MRKSYLELIERAITPQKARWSKNITISFGGEMVPALMWAPIGAAFASDSIILYVPYDPRLVKNSCAVARSYSVVPYESSLPCVV